MDIENVIDRLNTKLQSYSAYTDSEFAHVLEDAITVISTLQREVADLETQHRTEMCENGYDCVELGKVRTELERVKHALAEMWFAYENKDGELPHDFEEKAVAMAQEILGPWGEMVKWLKRGLKEDTNGY